MHMGVALSGLGDGLTDSVVGVILMCLKYRVVSARGGSSNA